MDFMDTTIQYSFRAAAYILIQLAGDHLLLKNNPLLRLRWPNVGQNKGTVALPAVIPA
jgi:hypothetical protein